MAQEQAEAPEQVQKFQFPFGLVRISIHTGERKYIPSLPDLPNAKLSGVTLVAAIQAIIRTGWWESEHYWYRRRYSNEPRYVEASCVV